MSLSRLLSLLMLTLCASAGAQTAAYCGTERFVQ
jgi:hypothetical protein